MTDKIKFRPVEGTQTNILRMIDSGQGQEGDIYFAYDVGLIYFVKDGETYTIGGSGGGGTSFIWADAEEDVTLFKDDEDSSSDPYYHMLIEGLENSSVYPEKGLLVINSDGRFFRVLNTNADLGIIYLQLIAVSGGSGGGGSYGGVTLTIAPDLNTLSQGYTYIYGKT